MVKFRKTGKQILRGLKKQTAIYKPKIKKYLKETKPKIKKAYKKAKPKIKRFKKRAKRIGMNAQWYLREQERQIIDFRY